MIEIRDGSSTVGGVLGTGMNLDISDTYSSVEIIGTEVDYTIGGITGNVELSTMPSYIQNCAFTGSVSVTTTDSASGCSIGAFL